MTTDLHITHLSHPDHNMRSKAVLMLEKSDHPQKYALLIQALRDENDVFVTEDITWALVQHTDETLPLVVELLGHDNPTIRQRAVHTLGKMGDSRAVEALIPVLDDAVSAIVVKCIFVLGQIGDIRAIPPLVQKLGDEHVDIEAMLLEVLTHFGSSALPHLLEALKHDNPKAREHAISILGELGDERAIPALIECLNDAEWHVRFEAVNALMWTPNPKVKKALIPLKDDPDKRVQALVNRMIGE